MKRLVKEGCRNFPLSFYVKVIKLYSRLKSMSDDVFVDEDEGLTVDELARTIHSDFEQMTDRENYDWKGGTLRPQDHESVEGVIRALEAYAPFPQHHEVEALYGDEDAGTHAEFSYNIRHILPAEMVEEDTLYD